MRRITPMLLAAVTTPVLLTALALPAQAQPADVSPAGTAAAVPSCVLTEVDDDGASDYVIVTNACRSAVRVQVVLDNYPDDACTTIPATESRSFDWFYPGRYDGLKRC
jgi:hypothetical protein